ncbi:hypothetical protein ACHAWF_001798 [Thalassiosira exigua]
MVAYGNVGVAMGLVCAAGAATGLGSTVVFFPALVKRASRRVLASSLGLSAGVMIYVSFVEIFVKSIGGFVDAGFDENRAYLYSTLSLFGGVLLIKIVDMCVRRLSGDHSPRRRHVDHDIEIVWNEDDHRLEMNDAESSAEIVVPHCVGCTDDPMGELDEWHKRADRELEDQHRGPSPFEGLTRELSTKEASSSNLNDEDEESPEPPKDDVDLGKIEEHPQSTKKDGVDRKDSQLSSQPSSQETNGEQSSESKGKGPLIVVVENVPRSPDEDDIFHAPTRRANPNEDKRRLIKMGPCIAIAITLHNFPEGLATFVAALDDPSVGAVLAIAVGIHNIPEGLCVSLPIYYATGNRCKAFMWGCLSGLSEPIAALLGWVVLAQVMTDTVYAILFGLVGGMIIMISLKELIPTAHRYDPEDTVVTYSVIVGMAVMALSLVLFNM